MISQIKITEARKLLLDEVNENLNEQGSKEFLLLAQSINLLTILSKRLSEPIKAKHLDKLMEGK
jgi:hypothetical protein